MPPSLALLLWFIFLLSLLCFDPAKDSKSSPALWVPVIWMFIIGSRLPSQWLDGQVGPATQALEEGNPIDRTVLSLLMLLAIGILISRSFNWSNFFARNVAFTAFLCFALLSVLWSDYSLVALKRWFRDLGNYLTVLIPLSDRRPVEAVRVMLRRLYYLLLPLAVLLIKYYPNISRQYDNWTGAAFDVGPTTSKNMLGVLCLLSGLFFFWDTLIRWSNRRQKRTRRVILVNLTFIGMTLWVLNVAKSTTSEVCLVLGCLVIAAAHSKTFQRRPRILKTLPATVFCIYLIMALGFGMNGQLAEAVGKDPTLTDRTRIWTAVLSMHTNPFVGTGYESFWMPPRLDLFAQISGVPGINEAHNGYLEVYLNLGIIGLLFLGAFLIDSYLSICKKLKPPPYLASLSLALWTALLFYCVTEAGFRGSLLWVTFLLGGLALPARVSKVTQLHSASTIKQLSDFPRSWQVSRDNHG